jgi:serine/threonine-protein kinase
MASRTWRPVLKAAAQPQFGAGWLAFVVGNSLHAVRFDPETLQVSSAPKPVASGLMVKVNGTASYRLSADGTLVYISGEQQAGADRTLVWVDRNGKEQPLDAPPRAYAYARISPDGTRIALDIRDQNLDTWIWDIARKTLTRLTSDAAPNRGVAWSPDGTRVAFGATRDGVDGIDWTSPDGGAPPELLTAGPRSRFPTGFSPDGTKLLFSEPSSAPYDFGMFDIKTGMTTMLMKTAYNEREPSVSPDGRWLMYQTNESGRDEIYVRPFPNLQGGRWQISPDGGTRPMWSRDGKEIFYYQAPGRMFSAAVGSGPTFSAGIPRLLFSGNYAAPNDGRPYDVTPDGTRFLMIRDDPRAAHRQMVVSLNWTDAAGTSTSK